MKQYSRLAAIAAVVGSLVVASIGAAPAATAVTWTKTAATSHKAYSWNGYKATVLPRGFTAPAGYQLLSSLMTVKRSGTVVARNVKSARLSGGTYTVYSTFTYRSKTAYTAYRTIAVSSISADQCTAGSQLESGNQWVIVDVTCTGWGFDAKYNDAKGSFSETVLLAADFDAYVEATSLASSTWTDSVTSASWESYATGSPMADSVFDTGAPIGDGTGTQAYTAYRYGPTKTAYRYRTATVTKVINTAVMTWNEYQSFGNGDSLSRVRAVVGSKGELRYSSGGYTLYRWRNTSGSYTLVWFYYGIWDDDAWYSA
jgi:hypothetical protein